MRILSPMVLLFALVGCSKNAPTTARNTDKDRLQGVWAVESVEGDELSPPERQRMTAARLHVQGERFTLGEGDNWEFSTFVTDWVREPKTLILYEVNADGSSPSAGRGIPKPARTRSWIYKFDGDKLVLAFLRTSGTDSAPAPADFKAEAGKNVVILRLVKTNEEPRTKWDTKPPADAKE